MNRPETGLGQVAFEAGDAHRIFTRLGEVYPANWESLVVVRRVLLVLNVARRFRGDDVVELLGL